MPCAGYSSQGVVQKKAPPVKWDKTGEAWIYALNGKTARGKKIGGIIE
jgi:hypothetical protein